LLDGVVHLAEGTEHAIGDRSEMGAVLLETLRQPVAFVHRSRSSVEVGLTE
jgi:hypothetical protein